MSLQEIMAYALVLAAGAWLVLRFTRSKKSSSCGNDCKCSPEGTESLKK